MGAGGAKGNVINFSFFSLNRNKKTIAIHLVYFSISGYDESGQYVDRPGQDVLLQALSGAMMSSGRDDQPPITSGQFLVDAVTAASEGTIAALLRRKRTGEGRMVSVNMLDVITSLQMQ